MSAILNIIAVTVGNFIYQSWNDHDWMQAAIYSQYQATAIFTYWLGLKFKIKWFGEIK